MLSKIHYVILIATISLIYNSAKAQDSISNPLLIIKAYNNNNLANKAIEYYSNITIPTNEINYEIARSYFLINDCKTAANFYIKINKQNNKLGTYELAQCYSCLNKPDFATNYLKQYLNQKDKKTISQIKSDTSFSKISNTNEWKNLWKEDWYSKTELTYNDAEYEYRIGNFEESNIIINELISHKKSYAKAFLLMAKNFIGLNLNKHALVSIDKAIEISSEDCQYLFLKSRLLHKTGKFKKALKTINSTLKIDSSNIEYYLLRAEIYLSLNKIESAENEIEFILTYIQSEKNYFVAGKIYTQSGNYLAALKSYNKSLKLNPNNTRIFILRGDVYELTKTYEFAEKDYSMALDFYPNEGEIYYKRGLVRAAQKRYSEACSDFYKARKFGFVNTEESISIYCR